MVINHNMSSLYANRQVGLNDEALSSSMQKLSSGERINRASDDASGLAVSEKMRSQIRGLNQASENIGNAVSFVQTAEGYLQNTSDILQRIRELAVQGSNGIYSDSDRMQIQVEVSSLVAEVDRIASSAQFNGFNMLTGKFAEEGIKFQIGAIADQNVTAKIGNMSAEALGLRSSQAESGGMISVGSQEEANATSATIDNALETVNKQRADLGAYQNRFEMAKKGIDNTAENLTTSDSRIRDTDMAETTVENVKNQILMSASSSVLAQSLNTSRENVYKLLG